MVMTLVNWTLPSKFIWVQTTFHLGCYLGWDQRGDEHFQA